MKALQLDRETDYSSRTNDQATTAKLSILPHDHGALTSQVYRLHSYRVLDGDGKNVGIVDWIWTDEASGHGEFLGVSLHWLRGKARAMPALGAEIDHETATIRVPYTATQIKHARRFKIDRRLTAREKRRICFHYELQPATLPSLMPMRQSAA